MFVNDLPADRGMLFIEAQPRDRQHVDEEHLHSAGHAVHRRRGAHRQDRRDDRAALPDDHQLGSGSSAVLELKGGEAARLGLSVGDPVTWHSKP